MIYCFACAIHADRQRDVAPAYTSYQGTALCREHVRLLFPVWKEGAPDALIDLLAGKRVHTTLWDRIGY